MTDITRLLASLKRRSAHAKEFVDSITFVKLEDIDALVEALEKAPQAPIMPLGLHPDTQKLVNDFCTALAEKLYKAQLKYGYDTDWKQDGWPSQCRAHFHQHIAKGDPRDVAAYCAFMWWHGWSTKPAEGLESRTVTVKLPKRSVVEVMHMSGFSRDYAEGWCAGNDNAIHQICNTPGIKWEAE